VTYLGKRQVRPFLRGPIPWHWLLAASALPGRALAVGVAVWFQAGLRGTRSDLPINTSRLAVPRSSADRGLVELERAGLVTADRHRGRCPRVTIVLPGMLTVGDLADSDDSPPHAGEVLEGGR
jgi:hypothetical protein